MVLLSVALLLSETPEGGYESILENADIQRFIWEHLNDVDRVIHCLGHASATVSALKLFLAAPEVVILGHDLRRPRPRTFQDGQDLHLASVQECHKRARFPWYCRYHAHLDPQLFSYRPPSRRPYTQVCGVRLARTTRPRNARAQGHNHQLPRPHTHRLHILSPRFPSHRLILARSRLDPISRV